MYLAVVILIVEGISTKVSTTKLRYSPYIIDRKESGHVENVFDLLDQVDTENATNLYEFIHV